MGVYNELRGFILAHRRCAGPRHADVDPLTPNGYRLLVKCGCGVEFKRWVAPEDADDVLLALAEHDDVTGSQLGTRWRRRLGLRHDQRSSRVLSGPGLAPC